MESWRAWTLVAIQFVLLAALVALPRGDLWPLQWPQWILAGALLVGGLVLGAASGRALGRSLTPSPIPLSDGELVTSGVYQFVRHPIYTALLVLGVGLVVIGASLWHVAAYLLLVMLLAHKARAEERLLAQRYEGYAAYARSTGRFLPGIGRWGARG